VGSLVQRPASLSARSVLPARMPARVPAQPVFFLAGRDGRARAERAGQYELATLSVN
jgi:hypothetical protein